jgi:hypothetical protein
MPTDLTTTAEAEAFDALVSNRWTLECETETKWRIWVEECRGYAEGDTPLKAIQMAVRCLTGLVKHGATDAD